MISGQAAIGKVHDFTSRKRQSDRLLVALLLASQASISNSVDDVRPIPEERLEHAGIDLTVEAMTATLLDPSAPTEIRYFSALALGRTGDPNVLQALLAALDDPETDVRGGAVMGLSKLAPPSAVHRLRAIVQNDPELPVRQAAIEALGNIGDEAAVDTLAMVANRTSEHESLRVQAITTLAHLGRPVTDLPLKDSSEQIRAASALALAETRGHEAVPGLVAAILDSSTPEWQRVDAVRKLEELSGNDFAYVGPYGEIVGAKDRPRALDQISRWWEINRGAYTQ